MGVGGGQDAAAKHKQLSELLRAGAPSQQGATNSPGGGPPMGGLLGNMNASPGGPGPQGLGPQQQHPSPQQAGLMQQAGMVGGLNRAMMAQKGNNGQQQGPTPQGMMGGQVMNGSPRMGYTGNPGMGSNSNLLAETLQQGGQQMGGPAGMRPQQPGALNKVGGCSQLCSRMVWCSLMITGVGLIMCWHCCKVAPGWAWCALYYPVSISRVETLDNSKMAV